MLGKEAVTIIEHVKNLGYQATDWEKNFILSILNQVGGNPDSPLSFKQSVAMETIYRKAAGGGIYQKKQYGYRRP